jgi:hypothetical protein
VAFYTRSGSLLCSFPYSGVPGSCTTSAGLAARTYAGIKGSFSDADGNYRASRAKRTVTLRVKKARLTITASGGAMTVAGTPPTIVAGYGGFVNGETPASLTVEPTCSAAATASSRVGSYFSSCSGAVDPNYNITYIRGMVTVSYGISVTVSPAPKPKNALLFTLQLVDASGKDVTTCGVVVTAVNIDGDIAPVSAIPDPKNQFFFARPTNSDLYRLSTTGLSVGPHSLTISVAGDPISHAIAFTVNT